MMRPNVMRIVGLFTVTLFVPIAVVVFGTKADSAAKFFPYEECVWYGITPLCTGWSGRYPTGYVQTQASGYYALRLMSCTSCNGSINWVWRVAASSTNYAKVTPAIRISKSGWYKSCGQVAPNAPWACQGNDSAVYLGD
jgi:hypothetical protein